MPYPATAVLAEFDRRSARFNRGRPMPVILDDAQCLGPHSQHTSRVRWMAGRDLSCHKALVVYLRRRSPSFAYTISHEVAHNLLYADGLLRLSPPRNADPEQIALVSQISTSTSHPLVVRLLEEFDWAVTAREAARAERFLRSLASGRARFQDPVAALIAAEFSVALGHHWLHGARACLGRISRHVEPLARELVPLLEACADCPAAVEESRREVAAMLLYGVELEGVNPLVRVAGPGWNGIAPPECDAAEQRDALTGVWQRQESDPCER